MHHVSRILRSGSILALLALVPQVISFLINNLVAKRLGIEIFGAFGILQTDLLLFQSLADLSMTPLVLAFYPTAGRSLALTRRIVWAKLALALGTTCLFVCYLLLFRRDHESFWPSMILLPSLLFQAGFFEWFLMSGRHWKTILRSRLLYSASYASLLCILIWAVELDTLPPVAFVLFLAGLPSFFYCLKFILKSHPNLLRLRPTFNLLIPAIKKSLPMALGGIASFAFIPAGLYITDYYLGASRESGLYLTAQKIAMLLSGFLLNYFSAHLLESKRGLNPSIKESFLYASLITLAISPIFIWPEAFLQLLFYGVDWDPLALSFSSLNLRFLLLSLVMQGFRLNLVSNLLTNRANWTHFWLMLPGAVLNVISCILCAKLKRFDIMGAFCLAGDVCFNMILIIYLNRKNLRFPPLRKRDSINDFASFDAHE